MRKNGLLNTICSFLGFALFLFLALVAINDVLNIVDVGKYSDVVTWIQKYGAITILAVLVFANFLGKTVVKIVFVVLFLGVGTLYILATFFPGVVSSLFGGGKVAEETDLIIGMIRALPYM